jgi:hypothetical protein
MLIATVFSIIAAAAIPSAAVPAPAPPPVTISHYMSTVDPGRVYEMGCFQASRKIGGIAVLSFGRPLYDAASKSYGVLLYHGSFTSIARIQSAVEAYLDGYWNCVPSGSSETLQLGVGTTNYSYDGPSKPGWVTREHGMAWAKMIVALENVVRQKGYASRLTVLGADDMEPSWSPAPATRAWVDGYASVTHIPLVNFGSADGCPPYGTCNNGWTPEDVWYVSEGSGVSEAFPEIYTQNGSQAKEWYNISLYGAIHHNRPIHFLGAWTQYQAADLCCTLDPQEAFTQLNSALNADPRTAQTLQYASDITWSN